MTGVPLKVPFMFAEERERFGINLIPNGRQIMALYLDWQFRYIYYDSKNKQAFRFGRALEYYPGALSTSTIIQCLKLKLLIAICL